MKIKIHFIVVLVCVMSSQIYTQDFSDLFRLTENYDEFQGHRTVSMFFNYLETEDAKNQLIEIDAVKYTSRNGNSIYDIYLICSVKDALLIPEGESLFMLIDGERVVLSGKGSAERRVVNEDGAYESANYVVTKSICKKMANAKEIKIKIIGELRSITDKLSEKNIANFKKFVEKCGD